jgi:hypothetical protein
MTKADLTRIVLIAILLAVPTALVFSFATNFFEPLLVPNMPVEEFRELSKAAQDEFIRSEKGLRSVEKMEKVWYLLFASPATYLLESIIMFVPLFLAGLLSTVFVKRGNRT